MLLWIKRPLPRSAYAFSVAYMFGMFILAPKDSFDLWMKIWFVTALPLVWIWTFATWKLQDRRAKTLNVDSPVSKT